MPLGLQAAARFAIERPAWRSFHRELPAGQPAILFGRLHKPDLLQYDRAKAAMT